MLSRFAVVAALALTAAPLGAGGVCVQAEGEYVDEYLLPENAHLDTQRKETRDKEWLACQSKRSAWLNDATGAVARPDCEKAPPTPEQVDLGQRANRMANAACEADFGFASSVKVYAYLDATKVEISTFHTDWLRTEAAARKVVLTFGSVPLRPADPVIVRVTPVRIGDPEPVLVAIVREAGTKQPKIEYLVRSWPDAKPVARRRSAKP
jgi:hypothetical protein